MITAQEICRDMRKAAVSFTGGKDCVLSLHLVHAGAHATAHNSEAAVHNNDLNVVVLVTFAPKGDVKFKAHPLPMIEAQASALGLQHLMVEVGDPYLESYRNGIAQLRIQHGIEVLVTGDILDVCDGFLRRATEGTGANRNMAMAATSTVHTHEAVGPASVH